MILRLPFWKPQPSARYCLQGGFVLFLGRQQGKLLARRFLGGQQGAVAGIALR